MDPEYIKPVNDKQRSAVQDALLQSLGLAPDAQINENMAKPSFSTKSPKTQAIIAQVRKVLIENGVDVENQAIIATLATFYQNLARILKA